MYTAITQYIDCSVYTWDILPIGHRTARSMAMSLPVQVSGTRCCLCGSVRTLPASQKRQGTKSREVKLRRRRKLYGD